MSPASWRLTSASRFQNSGVRPLFRFFFAAILQQPDHTVELGVDLRERCHDSEGRLRSPALKNRLALEHVRQDVVSGQTEHVHQPSLLTSWSFEPLQLAPVVVIGALYARRVLRLRRHGTHVPTWRIWMFGTGIALLVLAVASPISVIGEEKLFSF